MDLTAEARNTLACVRDAVAGMGRSAKARRGHLCWGPGYGAVGQCDSPRRRLAPVPAREFGTAQRLPPKPISGRRMHLITSLRKICSG